MTKKFISFLPLIVLLNACETIGNAADNLGSHLPTIGEPCHHWQCMTSDGQRQSDAIKKQMEGGKQAAVAPNIPPKNAGWADEPKATPTPQPEKEPSEAELDRQMKEAGW